MPKTSKKKKPKKPKKLKVFKLVFRDEHLYALYIAGPNKGATQAWVDDQKDIAGIVLDITDCKGTAQSFECELITVYKDLMPEEADFIVDEKGKEIEEEEDEDP